MRGTPAEATGCLVESHAELVGFDTLVIVDSQGNAVWDETGCSSIHALSVKKNAHMVFLGFYLFFFLEKKR